MQRFLQKVSNFLFLNIWSAVVGVLGSGSLFASIAILISNFNKWAGSVFFALPFFCKLFYIALFVGGVVGAKLLGISIRLFSSYKYKLREIALLVNKNKKSFRADTFDIFMAAPCGRLVTRVALYKLGKSKEYKGLLKRRKPFFARIKSSCVPQKVVIYSSDDFGNINNKTNYTKENL